MILDPDLDLDLDLDLALRLVRPTKRLSSACLLVQPPSYRQVPVHSGVSTRLQIDQQFGRMWLARLVIQG